MAKPKILIVGGGIGGMACATALAETNKFNVTLFESDIVGGQASSKKSQLCNTEISWRIIGASYNNFNKLLNEIGVSDNLYKTENDDPCIDIGNFSPQSNYSIMRAIFNTCGYKQINRILTVFLLSKSRAFNEYHDVSASEYLDCSLMNIILGPYFGLEPTKITLSAYYKNLFGVNNKNYHGDKIRITKYPTNDAIFEPWKAYLEDKGVAVYEHHKMSAILTDNAGKIKSITVNDTEYRGDAIVFACSVQPLVNMFAENASLRNTAVFDKLNILKTGQQFYITVNFYWKRPVLKDRKCHIFTFTDGWMPIILKRFMNTDYIEKHCDKNIKEVWNIGLADYLPGNYVKKFTSECSFDELVYEIKMNLLNSPHFKKYFDFENHSWEDYFYDYEFDDRYYQNLPSTKKFSINKGIEHNMLKNQEPEIGDNVYFSAYYVNNSVGGASMETSCEIGLTTADQICQKYNVENKRKPIFKSQDYIFLFTLPFAILDSLLYKLKLPPITDYVSPLILLVVYVIALVVVLVVILVKIGKLVTDDKQSMKFLRNIMAK
jgi:hypothetical protein